MRESRYARLADVLTGYSTALRRGDRVWIDAAEIPDEFLLLLIRAVRARGAEPFLHLHRGAISLLPRFYDPTAGTIHFHGIDLRTVAKKELRARQALVLQETVLLNGTVRENIAYGRPTASFREIEKAAKEAQADEFIRALPQGYQTQVGERGVMLSGGQRQRIGIARAFLRDAPILLLDEPTSALDPTTEKELLNVLSHLMTRPTTLLVTHRLHAAHRADRILVLEKGRLVEEGKGEDLLSRKGAYWKLWQAMGSV